MAALDDELRRADIIEFDRRVRAMPGVVLVCLSSRMAVATANVFVICSKNSWKVCDAHTTPMHLKIDYRPFHLDSVELPWRTLRAFSMKICHDSLVKLQNKDENRGRMQLGLSSFLLMYIVNIWVSCALVLNVIKYDRILG